MNVVWIALLAILLVTAAILLSAVRIVPNNRIGIIEKRFSNKGSVKTGTFIALSGEAGYQPTVLRGGIHFLIPLQYQVHILPLVTIPQGQIGYVFARDGEPMLPTQTLGTVIPEGQKFQDVEGFLKYGGQRGPQREILREGTYAFNLAQFVIFTSQGLHYLSINQGEQETFKRMSQLISERDGFRPVVLMGTDDLVGVVTVHDGLSLSRDEIIAPAVGDDPHDLETYHNNFQDPQRFLAAGGRRGRQLQVLVEGTYYINRLFATVETIPKTIVEVGFVGIVISYVGEKGGDISGEDYKHGELVEVGEKGVWGTPLMPGKYAFNTYAGKVVMVPTTNIILKWNAEEMGHHLLDENLSEIELITKDAFEPLLRLSVVIHIDYRKAPLVIQRFGDIKKLVEQTLDPLVVAYFKNIGQTRTLIELIHERTQIQERALAEMRTRFVHYNLELEEVLIGTPSASPDDVKIEQILEQLRDRQIALEQIETYKNKEAAAAKERELRQAEAVARQQTALTESDISIMIQSNEGKAAFQRSLQEAAKIKALAEADAEREARVGIARALAIEEQVRAYGGPQYQVLQQVMDRFSTAIEKAQIDIVPKMVVQNGGGEGGHYSAFEGLMALLLSEKLDIGVVDDKENGDFSGEIQKIRQSILKSLNTPQPAELAGLPDETQSANRPNAVKEKK